METILVRECDPDETGAVRALFDAVYRESISAHVLSFEKATAGEKLYVALVDGRIVGMASLWEPDAFIHFLFVDPAARHKKVGSTIINALAKKCSRSLTLKCLTRNETGLAFYRATGWQELETGLSEDGPYVLLRYNPTETQT